MKLSDFGLCKPLDCTNLTTISENESLVSKSNSDSAKKSFWKSPREKLQHWQLNRRTLVSMYIFPTLHAAILIEVLFGSKSLQKLSVIKLTLEK